MTDLGQDLAHKRALILAASALGRRILGLEADHADLDLAVAGEAVLLPKVEERTTLSMTSR